MTYSLSQSWHHERDQAWTHVEIPGVRIYVGRSMCRIETPGGVLVVPMRLDEAKKIIESVALAGAEGIQ